MATINELFIKGIKEGMKAAELITEPDKKAMAYAQLAQSLALTGMVASTAEDKDVPSEASISPAAGKGTKRKTTKKEVKVEEEPVVEESTDVVVEEEVDVAEEPEDVAVVEEETTTTEEVVEETAETVSEEEVVNSEKYDEEGNYLWSEEEVQQYEDAFTWIQQIADILAEQGYTLDEMVANFSEGVLSKWGDINPQNIDGFMYFLESLFEDENGEEPVVDEE